MKKYKAKYSRIYDIFGRCSLYATEEALCTFEICVIETAALGSLVSSTILKHVIRKLSPEKKSDLFNRISTNEYSGSDSGALDSPLKMQFVPVESSAVRKILMLLKATCLSWQCAGTVLAGGTGTGGTGGVDEDRLRGVTRSLQDVFEKLRISSSDDGIDGNEEGVQFNENLYAELEVLVTRTEQIIQPSLISASINPLPPLPSFQPQRKGSITNSGTYICKCLYVHL